MGTKIEKIKDAVPVMERCKALLPPMSGGNTPSALSGTGSGRRSGHPDGGRNLRGGRAISTDPDFYVGGEEVYSKGDTKIWLGAAEDTIFRKTGHRVRGRLRTGVRRHCRRRPSVQEAVDLVPRIPEKEPLHLLRRQIDRRQDLGAGTTPGRRGPGGLAHPDRALRPGYLRGGLRPGLRQPGRHGLRRRQAGGGLEDAALQQGPHLCLRQRGVQDFRRMVCQRRRRHQLGLPHHHQPGHPPGAAHRYLHL